MSANCLVTKLKSVVTNDNLVKVGELRYKFTTAGQMELLNRQVDKQQYPIVIVPIKGNIYFGKSKPVEPLNAPYTVTHKLDNGYGLIYNLWWDADSEFSIENYYDIAIGSVTPSAFTYLNQENGMHKILMLSGNLSDIDLNKTYTVKTLLITGKLNTKDRNILDFYRCLPMATRIENHQTTDVSYTMKQLGEALNTVITTFYGPNTDSVFFGVTGQIEDFVAMQKIKGRNEATINMGNMFYPEVTFNNNSINWGTGNLVWSTDGDNTSITYANKSTIIKVNTDGTWTRVS